MNVSARGRILIILAAALIMAGIFTMFSSPLCDPDMKEYDRLGYNLSAGRGFSLAEKAPFTPTMRREPMYPLFLAFVYTIFGHNIDKAILIQVVLHALTAFAAYAIAKEIFSERVAFLSGISIALFPTLANIAAYVMSETFFTLTLCLGSYVLIRALKKENIFYFLIAGVLFGILILTKAAALFLPLAVIMAIFAINIRKKMPLKRLFVRLACFLLPCLVIVSAWSARNKEKFDTFSPALRGTDALWSRAEKIDDSGEEIMATVCVSFSEYLGKRLFPDTVDKPNRYLFKDFDRLWKRKAEYRREGKSATEIESVLRSEALGKILKHPFKYLFYTPVEAIKMTAFTYLPLLNEKPDSLGLSISRGLMRMIAYPLLVLFFAGVIRNLNVWDRWILLFVIVLYFNTVYSLLDTIGRYAVPLIPFYCIFAFSNFYPVQSRGD